MLRSYILTVNFRYWKMQAITCLTRHIAQAVSHLLPTAGALVRARVRSCGIYGEQSGTGADFL
jgi:hypothetical protein